MNAQLAHPDNRPFSIGDVLHRAALESKAAVDAIPLDTDVADEMAAIEAATAPVDLLAKLILQTPNSSKSVKSRAQAWMDGHYWSTLESAA